MKKDWKYIAYLSLAAAFYITIKMVAPREFDWTVSYHHDDKNPFGAFALRSFLPSLFKGANVHHSNFTIYELLDTVKHPVNVISIASDINMAKEDTDALLKNIDKGGIAFLSAQYFSGHLADTLSIITSDYFFDDDFRFLNRNDTSSLTFVNPLVTDSAFFFPRRNTHNYFEPSDSVQMIVLTENDLGLPVSVKITHGKGTLILNSTPMAFTNAYLLNENNAGFASASLSYLPVRETFWTEYYHLGRLEAATPLRYILSTEPLRWAYYISILTLLLFMILEVKRKQRPIPILKPPSNTSLEFVGTIGNLYLQSHDHKSIAEKRIQFWSDQLLTRYNIHLHADQPDLADLIARKSGNNKAEVEELLASISVVRKKPVLNKEELTNVSEKLDRFTF